ncbi:hypothetical protein M409DRAFT_55835 [Zasmidium cellare ATCC 36951]|uniref:FAD-binding PCMH-type domain-containing protein n=1 Tax=Zasmidium cellare ATCC 36951 TaxID=1080233 RepID=A0A6A6CEE0_ZASCE|nr:uncharacterized protein M409DRAFT_55835 [Zasmidium cellare ATCC 36951]KAF2165441.1 hypothetical protein M409DRAFT_55835 [Zasmidium cellare ATCC 36951]
MRLNAMSVFSLFSIFLAVSHAEQWNSNYGHSISHAQAICHQLHKQIPSRVAFDNTTNNGKLAAAYQEATQRYNNAANADDVPACVLFPSCASDVSAAFKLLHDAPDVPFALKSGGHDWNRGTSSTNGGVLIYFRPYLNYTTPSHDGLSAEIGPGARWQEVIPPLEAINRTVVGGRYGDVGVGGYISRGGISYLSSQYGLASDSAIGFEIVLANGDIVIANKTSHPDLFWGMRGGSALFGAITKVILQTHPLGMIYAGTRTYYSNQTESVLGAAWDFLAGFKDPKAAITLTFIQAGYIFGLNGTSSWRIDFFYDGTDPGQVFDSFHSIPSVPTDAGVTDPVGITQYSKILNTIDVPNFSNRSAGFVSSYPNLPKKQMVPFLQEHLERTLNMTSILNNERELAFFEMAFQTIPVAFHQASYERGPAANTLDPAAGDAWWLDYTLAWANPKDDVRYTQALKGVVDNGPLMMQARYPDLKPTNYQGAVSNETQQLVGYGPLLATDAGVGQNVFLSYGDERYERLKAIQQRYDPRGLFYTQTIPLDNLAE